MMSIIELVISLILLCLIYYFLFKKSFEFHDTWDTYNCVSIDEYINVKENLKGHKHE